MMVIGQNRGEVAISATSDIAEKPVYVYAVFAARESVSNSEQSILGTGIQYQTGVLNVLLFAGLMRTTTVLAGVAAITAALPFASANIYPLPTAIERRAPPAVSTSYSTGATFLFTNGNRVYTTISIPIPITLSGDAAGSSSGSGSGSASPSGTASRSGGGGGGTTTTSDFRNATITGGNNTAIVSSTTTTSTTSTSLPFAPTTVDYGGGGTTVAAPVPGGSGGLPAGPPDSYHNGGALPSMVAGIVGIVVAVGSVAVTQFSWAL